MKEYNNPSFATIHWYMRNRMHSPNIKHINKLTRALYRRSAVSENIQIQELGHYDPAADKHLRPLSLLAR
jgi:hypothetical protein